MRRIEVVAWVLLLGWIPFSAPCAADSGPFVVDELLDGVWLFRAPGHPVTHTNSLVVEREAGLLVMEAQPSPAAARQLLEAVGKVSSKPIRYLVLTQATVESTGGASAFPDSALVVASALTHDALADEDRDISRTARLRAGDPAAWVEPPRVLPELLLTSWTHLADGERRVDLLPILRGHFAGFVMLRIEDEGLYYVGSMIATDRNPHADMQQTNVQSWIGSLNNMSMLRPSWMIPLHGEPVDRDQLRDFRDSLAWVLGQVENAFIEKIPEDEVVAFAMDSPKLAQHFDLEADPSFVKTLFEKALVESLEQRKKFGRR